MRIVVTGGSGRLGRTVVSTLARAGHEVVSADRAPAPDVADGVREVAVDLTDHDATVDLFERERPEAVVHLAAIAVPFSAPEDVILRTNTAMAWNVLEAAPAAGATRILAASSPTVIGYGAPHGWSPARLPLDETHPVAPWNAYSLSKLVIEETVAMAARRDGERVRYGVFRPCFVVSPEEWSGAPTQQGHTIAHRLAHPEDAAVSLFNYIDARDAAEFVEAWLAGADTVPNGTTFFVGADDALADAPLAELLPRFLPGSETAAAALRGDAPAFSSRLAADLLGWRPRRRWRDELAAATTPTDTTPTESSRA